MERYTGSILKGRKQFMRIIRTENYEQMGRQAANLIAAQITLKPDSVLGLATGSSPLSTYRHLIELVRQGDISFDRVRTVNLDEYVGLPAGHDQSYAYFMRTNLFDSVGLDASRTNIPNGLAQDGDAECKRYDELIASLGGIDLQLLGIGLNGHIGFNEPDDVFVQGTHKVRLTDSTIQANKRFFEKEEDVPRCAYTMGIRDIMQARRVVLIASGKGKAETIARAFAGPVTPRVPASILQLHKDFILVVDADAASLLP